MGSDGGICWVRVRDRAAFRDLTAWFAWRVLNTSAYAYKGTYAADVPNPPEPREGWEWIEGACGTDCDYDLGMLCELIQNILDSEPTDWMFRAGLEDVRNYTFNEIAEALTTEPGFDLWAYTRNHFGSEWWNQLGPLLPSLVDHLRTINPRPSDGFVYSSDLGHPPPEVQTMTLMEWAQKVAEILDITSYVSQETWT